MKTEPKKVPGNKRVSIITACFRSERTIKDTIDSVNIQTYPHIDHIIIDGASDDATVSIVKSVGKRVVHVTSEPDDGIFDAYNKGLAVAKGEVIGILNSDDFYATHNIIARVMREFEDESISAVHANLVYVDAKNTDKVVRHWRSGNYARGDFARGTHPAHPTLFLRKKVYDSVGHFNSKMKMAGDVEFMFRAFHLFELKSKYIDVTVVKMRAGGTTGGSFKSIRAQNREILDVFEANGYRVSKCSFYINKIIDRIAQRLKAYLYRFTRGDEH